ncbi:MAG: leucine-rich repeat domain-containing protein [Clostridia bacterium]|nr:leucine-rich repeat domain-containing protein [Clostridia bacterium]
MSEYKSVERVNALREAVEAVTGETYSDLAAGVQALIAGYGQGTDDFVGIKYSDFDSYRKSPRVADASSLPELTPESKALNGGYPALFENSTKNPNGGWNAMLTTVYLPKLSVISGAMFKNCGSLTTIYSDFADTTVVDQSAFMGCKSITTLPDMPKITTISTTAFSGCTALTELPYMPELTSIGSQAFLNCTGLTVVKLYSTLNSIISTSFNGCTGITDIYVPWAEGAVAGAPWGATNAAIHYNTVYDDNHNPIE